MFHFLFRPLFRSSPRPERQLRLNSPWLLGLLLVLAIFAVYANSLHGAWIYDDYADILGNQAIQRFWPIRDLFFTHVNGVQGTSSRPLVNVSFALNFLIGKGDTFVYHLTNLGIHCLATLCLFGLLRRLLERDLATRRASVPLAFATAFLWGIHPLQTEAVAYITQRYESIMALFVLLTFLCVTISTQSRRAWAWWIAAATSCFLALASKEVAVSLPLLVLLFDRTFLSGTFSEAWRRRRLLYIAFLGTWFLFVWNQLHVQGRQYAGFDLALPWWKYAMNQPAVILHYLRLAFWPHPLVLDYLWQPSPTLIPLVPGFLVIGALFAISIQQLIRNTKWGFLGAFFFCILAPTSSFMPVLDLAVEHRMYLPLAAVLTALVLGLYDAARHTIRSHPELARPLRSSALTLGACSVALLGSLTFIRSDDYRGPLNIWLDTVLKRPDNARAHSNYAHALQAAGFLDEAIRQTRIAVEQAPTNVTIRGNLGSFLAFRKRYDEAIKVLEQASALDPADARPLTNLGMVYTQLKNYTKAERCLQKAISLNPSSPQPHFALGDLYSVMHEYTWAIEQYQAAYRMQPAFSSAHLGAGNALLMEGRTQEALAEFQTFIKMGSETSKSEIYVGRALVRSGNVQEGYRFWNQAMESNPSDPTPKLLLAWTLSTHPKAEFRNGQEALALAKSVLESTSARSPAALEALAAAYAELGRFPEATSTIEEAIARLNGLSAKDLAPLRLRLDLYKAGKPYREVPSAIGS